MIQRTQNFGFGICKIWCWLFFCLPWFYTLIFCRVWNNTSFHMRYFCWWCFPSTAPLLHWWFFFSWRCLVTTPAKRLLSKKTWHGTMSPFNWFLWEHFQCPGIGTWKLKINGWWSRVFIWRLVTGVINQHNRESMTLVCLYPSEIYKTSKNISDYSIIGLKKSK